LQNLENDQGQTLLVCVVTIFLLLFWIVQYRIHVICLLCGV
jgi:hypothetical protein